MLINMGMFKKALEIGEKCLVEFADVDDELKFAQTYNNLGIVYKSLGEYEKAITYFDKDLQITKDKLGENHVDVAASYNNLGNVYKSLGEYQKAITYYDKALQKYKDQLGENHVDVAMSYNNLGIVYKSLGEYEKAITYH